jgi:hypothetical protein
VCPGLRRESVSLVSSTHQVNAMARLCPALPLRAALTAGEYAELELLETLERGLSAAYTLFHSVDWAESRADRERRGEIDIVVVNQSGDVLLMEVKSGGVEFRPDGIFKTYSAKSKNVTAQIRQQFEVINSRLRDAGLSIRLWHLLVLPDVDVRSETAQWPRAQIVDSGEVEAIVSRVGGVLGVGRGGGDTSEQVLAFFENRFRVEPDVSALAGRLQQATTRMSAGLATWVPRIESPSGVIRVVGTAGSGKTQLALRLLRDAAATGRKAAYLCFNRALADHMAKVAPVQTPAETFHEFALRTARRSGLDVDFSSPTAFAEMTNRCIEVVSNSEPDLDLIVIDELQDLQPEWVQSLLSRLRADGKAVLMEDPAQQVYMDRVQFDVADAVTVTSQENFRSPRELVRLINSLRLTGQEVEALSPYEGELPDPIAYEDLVGPAAATVQAVERCVKRGFAVEDIAIVCMSGRERSALLNLDQLGPWRLRRFTGTFDDGGNPRWNDGELLIDTVRRFKGQAAPAVVLTECDFDTLDEKTKRLLFVGITRARLHLEWVLSRRAAKVVLG